MKISAIADDDNQTSIIIIHGSLKQPDATPLSSHLQRAIDTRYNVIIDMTDVPFMHTAYAGLILAAIKRLETVGCKLVLSGPKADVLNILAITHLDKMIKIVNTREQAAKEIKKKEAKK